MASTSADTKRMKTVYVLGAGFSAPAGGPNQAKLLQDIFSLPSRRDIKTPRQRLEELLTRTLHIPKSRLSDMQLEDIFTPIDRCLADGVALRGLTQAHLQQVRLDIEYLISLAIENAFARKGYAASEYIRTFATHIVKATHRRSTLAMNKATVSSARDYDPVSVISLNWDIVLDKALHATLTENDKGLSGRYDPIGVVDYCCYISSLDEHDERVKPGLWALGAKGYNVKLLKLHGSMNWLQCTTCQRLFVAFDGKFTVIDPSRRQRCRHCEKNDLQSSLQGSLVMPTFLKDLSNFQVKLVWQNAGVELMEARKVVFIGYSLPHADFEFRQLLSRTIHKDAKIRVVLWKGRTKTDRLRYLEERARYRQFFPRQIPQITGRGVISYVRNMRILPIH